MGQIFLSLTGALFLLFCLLIFVCMFIYPVVLERVARGRALAIGKYGSTGNPPPLTLIIPAFNEAAVIERKIRNVRGLDYPSESLTVLVIDNGSTDGTGDIARNCGATVLESPPGKIAAVLAGCEAAKTEFVVLTDADVTVSANSLRSMVRYLSDELVAVCGSTVAEGEERGWFRGKRDYVASDSRMRFLEGVLGCPCSLDTKFLMVRRDVALWLPRTAFTDDYELTFLILEAGFRGAVDRDTTVHEAFPATLIEEIHQIDRRALLGAILTGLRHFSIFFSDRKVLPYAWTVLLCRRALPLIFPLFSAYCGLFLLIQSPTFALASFLLGVVALVASGRPYLVVMLLGLSKAWLSFFCRIGVIRGGIWPKIKLQDPSC